MVLMRLLLELTPEQETARDRSLVWLSILMGVVIIGGSLLLWLKRKISKEDPPTSHADAGFSLSSLREMRDRGEITSEEYERTRARVIEKVKSAADKPQVGKKDPRESAGDN